MRVPVVVLAGDLEGRCVTVFDWFGPNAALVREDLRLNFNPLVIPDLIGDLFEQEILGSSPRMTMGATNVCFLREPNLSKNDLSRSVLTQGPAADRGVTRARSQRGGLSIHTYGQLTSLRARVVSSSARRGGPPMARRLRLVPALSVDQINDSFVGKAALPQNGYRNREITNASSLNHSPSNFFRTSAVRSK